MLPYIISSIFFVGILEITRHAFYELVFEFVLGSILLFISQLVIGRLQNLREPKIDGPMNASVLVGLNAPTLGLLKTLLELRAEGVREFPIQQNALLVIALILLPSFDHGDRNSIYVRAIVKTFFAMCFFLLKIWENSRSRNTSWRNAARAVREVLRRM